MFVRAYLDTLDKMLRQDDVLPRLGCFGVCLDSISSLTHYFGASGDRSLMDIDLSAKGNADFGESLKNPDFYKKTRAHFNALLQQAADSEGLTLIPVRALMGTYSANPDKTLPKTITLRNGKESITVDAVVLSPSAYLDVVQLSDLSPLESNSSRYSNSYGLISQSPTVLLASKLARVLKFSDRTKATDFFDIPIFLDTLTSQQDMALLRKVFLVELARWKDNPRDLRIDWLQPTPENIARMKMQMHERDPELCHLADADIAEIINRTNALFHAMLPYSSQDNGKIAFDLLPNERDFISRALYTHLADGELLLSDWPSEKKAEYPDFAERINRCLALRWQIDKLNSGEHALSPASRAD